MGVVLRGNKIEMKRIKEKGQSTVEYVLLLAVVMFLIGLVMRSPRFQALIGEDAEFFALLKNRMEFSYRFTHTGSRAGAGREDISDPKNHDSFADDGRSRFAGATDPYGGN